MLCVYFYVCSCSQLEVCGGMCSISVVHQQRRCDLRFDLLLTKFRECTSKYYLAESQFWTSGSACFLDVLLNLNFGVKFAKPAMNELETKELHIEWHIGAVLFHCYALQYLSSV